nr:phosphatase PAP2 family protein [Rhizobium lusitanum]
MGPNSTVVVGAAFASTTGVTLLAFFLLLAAILVSFSRVYIGTHYISDIMGGALTGIFAAIIVKTLYKPETRVDRFITSIL